jgi:hypothetical protein
LIERFFERPPPFVIFYPEKNTSFPLTFPLLILYFVAVWLVLESLQHQSDAAS